MSHYEFHITVDAFLAAQRHALMSREICFADPVTLGATSFQVLRLEVGPNTIRHTKPASFSVYHESFGQPVKRYAAGRQTQIAQDLVVHVARHEDVINPQQPSPMVQKLPLRAVVDVDYEVGNKQCFQRTKLSVVEWDDSALPPPPPGISLEEMKAKVSAMLQTWMPPTSIPLNIAMSVLPGGGGAQVINAGVTVDTTLRRMVYRAEVAPAPERADIPWGNFYSGLVPDRLQNADWGFFIAKSMLEGAMTTLVWDSLKREAPSGVELISVGSRYENEGGKAAIISTVYANYDLPDPLGITYVEPESRAELSIRYLNWLVINVHLPDLKAMASGVMATARSIIQRLPAPLSLILGGILGNALKEVKDPTMPLANCVEITPLHHRCERYTPLPAVVGGQLQLERLDAQPDGIVLVGRLSVPALTDGQLESSVTPFAWVVPGGSCDAASAALAAKLASNPQLALTEARIRLGHTGTRPVYLCRVTVLGDRHKVFPDSAIRPEDRVLPTTLVVRIPNPGPVYDADRYPLDLLLHTTAGSMHVRVPPVPALTQADLDRLVAEQLRIVADCKAKMAPWWKYPRGFNPRWLIDPPFDKEFDHVWKFEVGGLREGELVSIFDGDDSTVLSSSAIDGVARFSMVVGAAAEEGMRVVHSAPLRAGQDDERGIAMTQQLLRAHGAIGLASPCRQVLATSLRGDRDVVAVTAEGLTLFDLSTPSRPMVMGHWPVADPRKAFNGPAGLRVVAADGAYAINPHGTVTRLGSACEPVRIVDAVVAPEGFYVLTRRALESRTDDFCVRDRLELAGGRSLARLGDRLVIGGAWGITTLRISPDGDWADPERQPLDGLDIVALRTHTEAPAGSLLAVLADGSACTLTMRDGQWSRTAVYARTPWFATSARIRELLVRIGDGGHQLLVGSLGESMAVGAEAMGLESARH